jgi:integrase
VICCACGATQVTEEGITMRQGKTGAGVLIEITPALQATLDALPRCAPYPARLRDRQETAAVHARRVLVELAAADAKFVAPGRQRFTFHDLRAKAGAIKATIEEAQALLGHASSETTKRVYKRNLTRARPDEMNMSVVSLKASTAPIPSTSRSTAVTYSLDWKS